jgi:hypothetical protein
MNMNLKRRLFKKSIPLWVVVLALVIAIPSIVIAVVIFTTPTVTNTMQLGASYGLQLTVANVNDTSTPPLWNPAPCSVNWGTFNHLDSHKWYMQVKNVGNVPVKLDWQQTAFPSSWTLTEVSAQANVPYSFGVFFEAVPAG